MSIKNTLPLPSSPFICQCYDVLIPHVAVNVNLMVMIMSSAYVTVPIFKIVPVHMLVTCA